MSKWTCWNLWLNESATHTLLNNYILIHTLERVIIKRFREKSLKIINITYYSKVDSFLYITVRSTGLTDQNFSVNVFTSPMSYEIFS